MKIRLEVEEYCHECMDFTADVTNPQRVRNGSGELTMSDTIVQCKYRKRCHNIKEYLERKQERCFSCETE